MLMPKPFPHRAVKYRRSMVRHRFLIKLLVSAAMPRFHLGKIEWSAKKRLLNHKLEGANIAFGKVHFCISADSLPRASRNGAVIRPHTAEPSSERWCIRKHSGPAVG